MLRDAVHIDWQLEFDCQIAGWILPELARCLPATGCGEHATELEFKGLLYLRDQSLRVGSAQLRQVQVDLELAHFPGQVLGAAIRST